VNYRGALDIDQGGYQGFDGDAAVEYDCDAASHVPLILEWAAHQVQNRVCGISGLFSIQLQRFDPQKKGTSD
jgi:hypothetical protein